MDLIEHVIYRLSAQAGHLSNAIDTPPETTAGLRDAASSLERAAVSRHGHFGAEGDTPEGQSALIAEVEHRLRKAGMEAVLNPAEAGDLAISGRSEAELLRLWSEVTEELRRRRLIRSSNRPVVGDYAELLVAEALPAERPPGRDVGVDLVRPNGSRIQVKARRDPAARNATHFDVARLDEDRFDEFAGVVFTNAMERRGAWLLSIEELRNIAQPKSGGGHRVTVRAIEDSVAGGAGRELEL